MTEKDQIETTRDTIIEALSWAEDLGTGRWGYDRAAALLDGYVRECVALELRAAAEDVASSATDPDADIYCARSFSTYLRQRALAQRALRFPPAEETR